MAERQEHFPTPVGPASEDTGQAAAGANLGQALQDAQEQLLASREVLLALGRERGGSEQVLDTIIERAARLCRADAAHLYLLDGDLFRVSRMFGEIPDEYRRYLPDHPVQLSRPIRVARLSCTGWSGR